MKDIVKLGDECARRMRNAKTVKDAHVVLAMFVSCAEREAVEEYKRRVREMLGIPEGVPCCGDEPK